MRRKEVLILSSIDWDFLWQRHQILATLFARAGWKVVYVDGTGIRNPGLKETLRIIFNKILGIGKPHKNPLPEGCHRIKPLTLPSTYKIYRKINGKFMVPTLVKRIKKTGIKNPIVIAYLPTQTTLDILKGIKYRLLIYDCVSNFKGIPGIPEDIPEREKELIGLSNIILADSDFLYKKMNNMAPDRVFQIMPGVDYELFSRGDSGPIKQIKRLCYFGGINIERIDLPMIFSIARKMPDKEFVFIGPLKNKISDRPENVIFLPQMKKEELPEKLRDCDCILLPYKKTTLTRGIIPAKFFEVLATGKPVIATGIEENIKKYSDIIYIARTEEEFYELLEKIIHLETGEKYLKRKSLAKENSWEKRFQTILKIIEENEKE